MAVWPPDDLKQIDDARREMAEAQMEYDEAREKLAQAEKKYWRLTRSYMARLQRPVEQPTG